MNNILFLTLLHCFEVKPWVIVCTQIQLFSLGTYQGLLTYWLSSSNRALLSLLQVLWWATIRCSFGHLKEHCLHSNRLPGLCISTCSRYACSEPNVLPHLQHVKAVLLFSMTLAGKGNVISLGYLNEQHFQELWWVYLSARYLASIT